VLAAFIFELATTLKTHNIQSSYLHIHILVWFNYVYCLSFAWLDHQIITGSFSSKQVDSVAACPPSDDILYPIAG
jgi:hypothetical protein